MSGNCKEEMKKPAAEHQPLELATVRARLAELKGRRYWRSLEELADTEEFREMLHREFPRQASVWNDGVSRRNFLQLMGASLALAGLSGCTKQPPENIVPYVRQPEIEVPGKPLFFATSMPLGENTIPLIVKSDEGRPIKIEGNPDHPFGSMGTDVYAQASLLGMYDPDRSQTITELGDVRAWDIFQTTFQDWLTKWRANQGEGLYFLSGISTSPTFAAQMDEILKLFPKARWYVYEPVNRDNAHAGARMAFGQAVEPIYQLQNTDVILSFDDDLLSPPNNPNFLRNAWNYGQRRKVVNGDKMNRLYVVESLLTPTGAKADHRLPVRATEIAQVAQAVADGVTSGKAASGDHARFVNALVKDLQQHRGACLVTAGETQPPEVHALCHAMNQALGNVGKTVDYAAPVGFTPPGWSNNRDSIGALAEEIRDGKVQTLFILDSNPCLTAPDDLDFRHTDDPEHNGEYKRYSILEKIPLIIHLGLYQDETASVSHWHVDMAHYLEAWGDARTPDGTVSIIQPLIDPLYGGKSVYELLGQFTDKPSFNSYEWVRSYWLNQHKGADFETVWRKTVHDGYMAASTPALLKIRAKTTAPAPAAAASEGFELVFRPDYGIYDGRFANNAWLQELPRPIGMVTWDNAAYISLKTAEKLGIKETGPVLEIDYNGRKLRVPSYIVPGSPDQSITLHLGYGRNQGGRTANQHGCNSYMLRTLAAPNVATGVNVKVTDETAHVFASVHMHHNVEFDDRGDQEDVKRGILREATLAEYKKDPNFAHSVEKFEQKPEWFTLYHPTEHPYGRKATPHAWGMSIDLNACIGCSTCVVACQAENNIPVVGWWEVRRGREMHWIRIDNYFVGDYENPRAGFMPVPCMQCEDAPCEVVCPVGATVHSTEGLNDMVYNRCVGTRYCSNNCPYKVRRFNFMLFADYTTEQFKLMHNPDVTVRSRGVMEKCTYCVQRINEAKITAEKEDRFVRDGEIQTACQQACPTQAIIFGNINDPNSRVSKLKRQTRDYSLLAELNTRPRTTYLAKLRNPNPEISST